MKKYIVIFIIIICICFGYIKTVKKKTLHTQNEMILIANTKSTNIDKKLNEIYNKIITIYNSDKIFIERFKIENIEFKKYREIQIKTVLTDDATFSNYSIYYNSYFNELTNNKILDYKRMLKLYCLYNSHKHPKYACSEDCINNIFESNF